MLITILIALLGGFYLFVAVMNFISSSLRADLRRLALLLISLATCVAGALALGYWAVQRSPSGGAAFSLAVLAALLVSEGSLIVYRQRRRGSPPVERRGGSQRAVTSDALAVLRYRINGLNRAGDSENSFFRIVQLSDLHLNRFHPLGYYQRVFAQANQLEADILLITGDLVAGLEDLPQLEELLAGLRSRRGVYASLGNHDFWHDPDKVVAALERAKVTVLRGESLRLPLNETGQALVLCGDEYPWGADLLAAYRKDRRPAPGLSPQADLGISATDVTLVLSHTADNVYRYFRAGLRPTAVFSGHYHGGQVVFPILGALITPSRYGRRLVRDHWWVHSSHWEFVDKASRKITHVFVSTGIGMDGIPLRLNCAPEILVVDIEK